MRNAIFAILLVGCSAPPDMTEYEQYRNDIDRPTVQDRVMTESFAHWDEVIGYRNEVEVLVTEKDFDFAGTCNRRNGEMSIEIYMNKIDNVDGFRAIFLHELAHAHLTCGYDDHIDQPNSVLSPELNATEIDELTRLKVQNALAGDG